MQRQRRWPVQRLEENGGAADFDAESVSNYDELLQRENNGDSNPPPPYRPTVRLWNTAQGLWLEFARKTPGASASRVKLVWLLSHLRQIIPAVYDGFLTWKTLEVARAVFVEASATQLAAKRRLLCPSDS